MSAGTLTLTNNSAQVSGAGTSFNTELAAGDFIVVTVGGIPYTLPVKSIESDTALTLVSNFTGPTQAGCAWSAVPRIAMNLITAAVVTQAAEALRGLNYDKQNWQQIFSASGNITVTLPDGAKYSGPSWLNLSESTLKKANNLSDVADIATTRTNLGLNGVGSYAASNIVQFEISNIDTLISSLKAYSLCSWRNNTSVSNTTIMPNASGIFAKSGDTWFAMNVPHYIKGKITVLSGYAGAGITENYTLLDSRYYTVDTNGFYKTASPIIKLKGDGTAELNEEAQGATVERISLGVYKVSGVLGFNADPIWGGTDGGFVIPHNNNGLPLLWVDYDIDAEGSITLKTYHRTHPSAPAFAQNIIEAVKDGDPVDIPVGRWIDLRVEMPANSIYNQNHATAMKESASTGEEVPHRSV